MGLGTAYRDLSFVSGSCCFVYFTSVIWLNSLELVSAERHIGICKVLVLLNTVPVSSPSAFLLGLRHVVGGTMR